MPDAWRHLDRGLPSLTPGLSAVFIRDPRDHRELVPATLKMRLQYTKELNPSQNTTGGFFPSSLFNLINMTVNPT